MTLTVPLTFILADIFIYMIMERGYRIFHNSVIIPKPNMYKLKVIFKIIKIQKTSNKFRLLERGL